MNASELFEELQLRRVELWCQGKMLRFRAPDDALDAEMMTLLRRHKKALIEIIQNEKTPEQNESRLEAATVGQQALYFLHLSAPYSPAYNVASACRIGEAVKDETVLAATELLVQRHESLRTTLEFKSGELKRRIHPEANVDFASIDARDLNEEQLAVRVKAEYERPFDLETGPLIRVRWLRTGPKEQILLVALHHIVFDAWSLWILQEELFQLLAQVHGGEIAKLPASPATYSDFAQLQQDWVDGEGGQKDWQYWSDELAGKLPSLDLVTDYRRPNRAEYRGATLRFQLPCELTGGLREVAKSLHVTPFALTMAIFKVLLHRLTGQDDLIVGTTTSGRERSEFQSVIGYFVNSLSIRTDASEDPTFDQYATQVKSKVLGAIKHQGFPFVSIVDRLSGQPMHRQPVEGQSTAGHLSGGHIGNGKRRSGGNPVFSVMFGLQKPRLCEAATLMNDQTAEVEMAGFPVRPYRMDQQEGQCDLTLEMFDTEESFVGTLKYDTDLFSDISAERISQQYIQLCEQIVNDPRQPVSAYEIVSAKERQEILSLSASTELPPWDGSLIHQWVQNQCNLDSSKIAWICDDEQQSYGDLDAASDRVACLLIDEGVSQGDLIPCCVQRSWHAASMILGILKVGAVYVPVDVDGPLARIHGILQSCNAKYLITDQPSLSSTAFELSIHVITADRLSDEITQRADISVEAASELKNRVVTADSTAYLLHTSGSTGTPKGVCVSHGAIARHIASIVNVYDLTSHDCVLQFSNSTFDPSLEQMFSAWFVGARVVARGNEIWPPETLWDQVEEHGLTVVNLPPAYFQHCEQQLQPETNLGPLRLLIFRR